MNHSGFCLYSKTLILLFALVIAFSPVAVKAQTHALDSAGTQPDTSKVGIAASGMPDAGVEVSTGRTSLRTAFSTGLEAGGSPVTETMTISQTLSDEAQRNTIAFDGLAFLTGSLGADSFFPPGKVADFWGFQYLRDNDPSQMGHNPLFLTSAAFNMWNILTDDQRQQLKVLANNQVSSIDDYAYQRFVLMNAFRRLLEGDVPSGSPGLDQSAVEAYSAKLYRLDVQMSYERAQVMGNILSSLTLTQTTYLKNNMLGKGMLDWPAVTDPADMNGLDREVKEALMTYAGDLYSWYAGSLDADVYFCPERQGTYFGSFYLKDTPVMSTGGTIDSNLTANAGVTFTLILDPAQAALVTGLVQTQKPALYAIVDTRRAIAVQLRRFIVGETVSNDDVLKLADQYGELDGEIIYQYARAFAAVNQTLTSTQKADLLALRKKILGDFDLVPDPYAYRYADRIDMPAIANTDFLFLPAEQESIHSLYLPLVVTQSFSLSSPEIDVSGILPAEYTCDGASVTLPLEWRGAPSGTQSFAVIMHHVASADDIHWYWVLYDIPTRVTSLAKNTSGIGTLGTNSVNGMTAYAPPCSKGPGEKVYTYTVYALSAQPQFSVPASQVTRAVLLDAIQDITLDSAELNVSYTRP